MSQTNLSNDAIKQLVEALQITEQAAKSLLEKCNGNLEDAFNLALNPNSRSALPSSQSSQSTTDPSSAAQAGGAIPLPGPEGHKPLETIDLTMQDDLQKAIKLSLEDENKSSQRTTSFSLEEQELSRAVEASIQESKSQMLGLGMVFVDPLNPHERKRQEGTPVGLKNVGNTCWFSSVIQSLFFIPAFRNLILNYNVDQNTAFSMDGIPDQNNKESSEYQLFNELKKLFSLLIASERKYSDPSTLINILKKNFPGTELSSSNVGRQQDVSEFIHILMENLEKAVSSNSNSTQDTEPSVNIINDNNTDNLQDSQYENNIIKQFFYGSTLTEGRGLSSKETFRSLLLRVGKHEDLYSSIEATLCTETEEDESEKHTSWLTHLPPVLMLELSRFQFNKNSGTTEKIHKKLSFDPVLCLDRFLLANKDETCVRREKVKELRKSLNEVLDHLSKYTNYNESNTSLSQTLDNILHFVSQSQNNVNSSHPTTSNPTNPTSFIHPMPNTGSLEELEFVSKIINQWKQHSDQAKANLENEANGLNTLINEMYVDEKMNLTPYRLHAVLVHDGGASTGHYWAYIFLPNFPYKLFPITEDEREIFPAESMDTATDSQVFSHPLHNMEKYFDGGTWMKFNDITIQAVNWNQVVSDSIGMKGYTSAYCLIYVKIPDAELFRGTKPTPNHELEVYVKNDNEKFVKEIEEWDLLQTPPKINISKINEPDKENIDHMLELKRLVTERNSSITNDSNQYKNYGLISSLHFLHSIALIEQDVCEFAILQDILPNLRTASLQLFGKQWKDSIAEGAKPKLNDIYSIYNDYCRAALYLVYSYQNSDVNRYSLSLRAAAETLRLDNAIVDRVKLYNDKYSCALDRELLIKWFMHILEEVNEHTIERALSNYCVMDSVKQLILPAISFLREVKSKINETDNLINSIRDQWCNRIEQTNKNSNHFEQALELMLDDAYSGQVLSSTNVISSNLDPGIKICDNYNKTVVAITKILEETHVERDMEI